MRGNYHLETLSSCKGFQVKSLYKKRDTFKIVRFFHDKT